MSIFSYPTSTPNPNPYFDLEDTPSSTIFPTTVPDEEYLNPNGTDLYWNCARIDTNYESVPIAASISIISIGLFFCVQGTRQYKSTLFLTGFSLGLILVFLICQSEELLPQWGNALISTFSALLYGLICLLVAYVGFFNLGFISGLILGVFGLILAPMTGQSVWTSLVVLLAFGLFVAIVNVSYPSVILVTSPLIGSTLIMIGIDYFLHKYSLSKWAWSHVSRDQDTSRFCWYTWGLVGIWPTLFLLGFLLQWFVTAKGFRIPDEYGYRKGTPRRAQGSGSTSNTHSSHHRPKLTREERTLAKYKYLYQVRTSGGDILAQSYVESVRNHGILDQSENPPVHVDTLSTNMGTLEPSPGGSSSGGGGGGPRK